MRKFELTTKTAIAAICLLPAVIFCGCDRITTDPQKLYYTIELDSCEYLLRNTIISGSPIHKGNCKFCIARQKNNCR